MNEKRLYRTFSATDFIKKAFRLVAVFAAVFFSLLHFDENRVLFTIVLVLVALIVLFMGNEVIEVYKDRMVHRKYMVLGLFNRVKVFSFSSVRDITYNGSFDLAPDLAQDIGQLLAPRGAYPKDDLNTISVTMNDGSQVSFRTRIYRKALEEAFASMHRDSDYHYWVRLNNGTGANAG